MLSMSIQHPVYGRESSEQKPWSSEARKDVLVFLAQSLGIVGAAMFLYSLGPALSAMLIAVSLAVWSLLRSQIASEKGVDGPEDDGGQVATVNSPSHAANSAWSRNSGMSSTSTARSLVRQGA
jgi:hypothetical protein